jgi:hypothetical protein
LKLYPGLELRTLAGYFFLAYDDIAQDLTDIVGLVQNELPELRYDRCNTPCLQQYICDVAEKVGNYGN